MAVHVEFGKLHENIANCRVQQRMPSIQSNYCQFGLPIQKHIQTLSKT